MKGVHYKTQVRFQGESGRQQPDAVIHMQDGFNIVIDAKAPLRDLADSLAQETDDAAQGRIMSNLAAQVREHVKKLGAKNYWENLDSVDFTVLFLPSEHLYSLALRAEPGLVEFAAQKNIIIASPTLLLSLLRVVGISWRQVELAQNAQEISELGYDLYKRFLKFIEHFEKWAAICKRPWAAMMRPWDHWNARFCPPRVNSGICRAQRRESRMCRTCPKSNRFREILR